MKKKTIKRTVKRKHYKLSFNGLVKDVKSVAAVKTQLDFLFSYGVEKVVIELIK
jgi:hypothetical protein